MNMNLRAIRSKKVKGVTAMKKSAARKAARRLAAMGGSCPQLESIPRRRPPAFTNS